eukprot:1034633-Rhodomonas_salina.1
MPFVHAFFGDPAAIYGDSAGVCRGSAAISEAELSEQGDADAAVVCVQGPREQDSVSDLRHLCLQLPNETYPQPIYPQ